MLLFFKVSVLLYSAVFGISQLLKLSSYKFLVPTFGAITVIFAIAIFNSVIEHSNWEITGAGPVYATFFLLIMPAVTITVAVIRGFLRKRRPKRDPFGRRDFFADSFNRLPGTDKNKKCMN
jgi:spore germination protein KB